MATVQSGQISMSDVNAELQSSRTTQISFSSSIVRRLLANTAGTVTMSSMRGKTYVAPPAPYGPLPQFTTATETAAGPTSLVIPNVPGIIPGDVLILVFKQFDNRTMTTPAGWTSLGFDTATTRPMVMFWKIATVEDQNSSTTLSWASSFSSPGSLALMFAIRGGTTPDTTTRANSQTAPSVTTSKANEWVAYVGASAANSGGITNIVWMTGYEQYYRHRYSGSTETDIFIALTLATAAGAVTPSAPTITGGGNLDSTRIGVPII